MSGILEIEKKDSESGMEVSVSGIINEDSELGDIFQSDKDHLIIDLKEVKRINSCGIREWVNAIETVPAEKQISFVNCSTAIIQQINMVSNFVAHGKVVSFMAPYYCEECDDEHEFLLEMDKHFPDRTNPSVPEFKCPDCQKDLEFDDVEEKYLLFIKRGS